jgi:hypothetical protein
VGRFYGNVTLIGIEPGAVEAALDGPAFLYEDGARAVVFAADDDPHPQSGARLSALLDCVAFSVGVHDDDLLFFEVHRSGRALLAGAVPDPSEVFDQGEPGEPPDADELVAALGQGDAATTAAALAGDFVFASDRHTALAEALELPTGAAGWGYRYLDQDGDVYQGPALMRHSP